MQNFKQTFQNFIRNTSQMTQNHCHHLHLSTFTTRTKSQFVILSYLSKLGNSTRLIMIYYLISHAETLPIFKYLSKSFCDY